MPQLLLFPDPRPLVERLGQQFFREVPQCPGVYVMRDAADTALYVGKAKNLRKRLASYRVANPDRIPRRHLRLLRAVARIELQECPDEASALARESELLLSLRPRFNRAGTWPRNPRFLVWKTSHDSLELAIKATAEEGWQAHGPLGGIAWALHGALVRLLWCAIYPSRGLTGMPAGWFRRGLPQTTLIPRPAEPVEAFETASSHLRSLFAGNSEGFTAWILEHTSAQNHPFESAIRQEDLETLQTVFGKEEPASSIPTNSTSI